MKNSRQLEISFGLSSVDGSFLASGGYWDLMANALLEIPGGGV